MKTYYKDKIKKVAIIDFDVHHGNGTEQIIECLRPKMFSYSFSSPYFGKGTLRNMLYKPWYISYSKFIGVMRMISAMYSSYHLTDLKQSTLPISILVLVQHTVEFIYNPLENTLASDPAYPGGILNIPFQKKATSMEWRLKYIELVLPRLLEFCPDFILISAGFDAHERDLLGTSSHIALSEFDYSWITQELVKIANMTCEGRIVSMLEGGYNTTGGGLYSPLGNSIFNHVFELSHGYGVRREGIKEDYKLGGDKTRFRKYTEISNQLSQAVEAPFSR